MSAGLYDGKGEAMVISSKMMRQEKWDERNSLVLGGHSARIVAHVRRTLESPVESEARIVRRRLVYKDLGFAFPKRMALRGRLRHVNRDNFFAYSFV